MKRHGEKLYTVEFSSSYDYDYDEYDTQSAPPKQSPKKPIVISKTRIVQATKGTPNLGGLIELSDSYDSYDSDGHFKSKIAKLDKQIDHSNSESNDEEKDAFTLADTYQDNFHTSDNVNTKTTTIQFNNNFSLDANQNNSIENDDHTAQSDQTDFQNQEPEKDVQFLNQSPTKQFYQDNISSNQSPSKDSEIQESQMQQTSQYTTYLITRERKTHLNGRRLFFNLYIGKDHIYTAKCKTKNAHHVYIMKGDDAHLGSDADAIILIGNDSSDFSLRKKKDLGAEVLTVRIVPPKTSADTSRKMTISFFTPFKGMPKKIFTKFPTFNSEGKIEHDFEGRFAIESVKNAVLVAKQNGPKMMFIRKTAEDSIEIEATFEHEDLWIFAIGIASFLSKVKGIK